MNEYSPFSLILSHLSSVFKGALAKNVVISAIVGPKGKSVTSILMDILVKNVGRWMAEILTPPNTFDVPHSPVIIEHLSPVRLTICESVVHAQRDNYRF